MIYEHLSSKKHSKNWISIQTPVLRKKIKNLLNKQNNIFIHNELKYLNEADNKINFYWFLKIQKLQLLTNRIKGENSEVVNINKPLDIKERSIVGGPKCPTRELS